jgi:hypothetical protein
MASLPLIPTMPKVVFDTVRRLSVPLLLKTRRMSEKLVPPRLQLVMAAVGKEPLVKRLSK